VDGDIGKKETAVKVAEAAVKTLAALISSSTNAGIYIPKPFTDYTPEDLK